MPLIVDFYGQPLPVTHLFDLDNDETDDLADAVTFVAGPMLNGEWAAGLVSLFAFSRPH